MMPQRSVRGPRGAKDTDSGQFKKPGVLGGLSVSPWVVEEETEKAQRVSSHRAAVSKVNIVTGLHHIVHPSEQRNATYVKDEKG